MQTINQTLYDSISSHLFHDNKPSEYLNLLSNQDEFKLYPFSMLLKLKKTEQSPIHHPEGNVWNHTMMVVDQAAIKKSRSNNPSVFMWAALLHDIGKPSTTRERRGRITAYNHDNVGAKLAKEFLTHFTSDQLFIDQVISLVKYHMQILYVLKELPFAAIQEMKQESNINEIALLGLCDRLGRTGSNQSEEENNILHFISKCNVTHVS